jgi:hypothetical protein
MRRVPDFLLLALPEGLSDRFSDDKFSAKLLEELAGLWSESVSII